MLKDLFSQWRYGNGGHKMSYSSMSHPELTSTAIEVNHSVFCYHCSGKALPVQNESYRKIGNRCVCDEAMKEMAARAAHALTGVPLKNKLTMTSEQVASLLMLKSAEYTITDDKPFEISSNVKVIFPLNVSSYHFRYIEDHNRGEKLAYSDSDKEFIALVNELALVLTEKEIAQAEKQMEDLIAQKSLYKKCKESSVL
jgi:hypothetical protein